MQGRLRTQNKDIVQQHLIFEGVPISVQCLSFIIRTNIEHKQSRKRNSESSTGETETSHISFTRHQVYDINRLRKFNVAEKYALIDVSQPSKCIRCVKYFKGTKRYELYWCQILIDLLKNVGYLNLYKFIKRQIESDILN